MALYILVKCPGKRPGLRGPYSHFTAEKKLEALEEQSLENKDNVEGEIISFPTRNLDTASRMLKEGRIDTEGYLEGTKNLRHKGVLGTTGDN